MGWDFNCHHCCVGGHNWVWSPSAHDFNQGIRLVRLMCGVHLYTMTDPLSLSLSLPLSLSLSLSLPLCSGQQNNHSYDNINASDPNVISISRTPSNLTEIVVV